VREAGRPGRAVPLFRLLMAVVVATVAGGAAPVAAAPDPRIVSLLEGDLGVILEPSEGGRFASLRATSSAMEPAFGVGDMVSVDRGAYDAAPIGRGDVVAFRPTASQAGECGATGTYVKRVVAIGGDTIEVRDGLVLVGGAPLAVAGADPPSYELPARVVPSGSFFVLGDRRNLSCDSHSWTRPFVPAGRIVGRVDAVYHPRYHVGLLPPAGGRAPVDVSTAPGRPRLDFAVVLGKASIPVLVRTRRVRDCAARRACRPYLTGPVRDLGRALTGMRWRITVATTGLAGDCAEPVARRLGSELFSLAAVAGRIPDVRSENVVPLARAVEARISVAMAGTVACWSRRVT